MFKIETEDLDKIEGVSDDRDSAEKALEVALNFFTNRMSELRRESTNWWLEMGKKYGFDPRDGYGVKTIDGVRHIVKCDKDENDH